MLLLPVPSAAPLPTQRLCLRPYTPADAPSFFALLHHERQRLQPAFPRRTRDVNTLTDAERLIQQFAQDWRQRRLLVWGIWLRQSNAYLGEISLQLASPRGRRVEVSYYLASTAEGHGYAREALAEIARYTFEHLGSETMLLRCRFDNPRSVRIAQDFGFHEIRSEEPGIRHFHLAAPTNLVAAAKQVDGGW